MELFRIRGAGDPQVVLGAGGAIANYALQGPRRNGDQ